MTNGLFTAWAQCPLGAAIKASQTGKIKVGWTIAKIELLKARPLQCFRCWGHGHLKANCTSPNDRSKNCYRCGEEGHSALACVNPPACVLCKEQGKDSRHRVGSTQCKADFITVKRGKPGRKAEEEMITENATWRTAGKPSIYLSSTP
ncbi:DNA-binding protein HEXBP-like [Nylanderia fulva]|uniref:DNA-binding protein HEXBP-like n=1 Tax=Nylanderia fulva TaxID=613905 RepID=UPI0010FB4AE9|nr:DNA-binding protein HEXBP-like [Nylanderia fulva]